MFSEKELNFAVFILYSLAKKWRRTPSAVYKILNTTGILDEYIIAGYDILHTLEKE